MLMDKIYTGFENLDKSLWIYKGNLVVFAAPQRTESLCFFCSIMENITNKLKCLFFSMETSRSNRVESLMGRTMDYSSNMMVVREIIDFEELLITVAEQKLKNGIDAVFIDNFYDLHICSKCSEKELVLKIKDMAKRLNIAIVINEYVVKYNNNLYNYKNIAHKEFIKYADKILIMYNSYEYIRKKGLIKERIIKDRFRLRKQKDVDNEIFLWQEFKFDNTSLRFYEIP
jgi:hypothetical protein